MRITKAQFKGLDQYKYSGIDKSVVSRHVLGPFWTWLVTLFPKSLAPNSITFIGLCFVITNVLTLFYLDPTYTGKELPPLVYLSWAIGLFAYQSMDAIDGKQARRLNMGSALGEMFDHGCDAINTTVCELLKRRMFPRAVITPFRGPSLTVQLESILCCHALGLTRSWWTVASQAATLCNFYASTWEEYHTGTLYLSAFSGPVEGILMIVAIYAITALHPLGVKFWSQSLVSLIPGSWATQGAAYIDEALGAKSWLVGRGWAGLGGLPLNVTFMIFGAFGTVANIVNSYYNVIAARRKAGKAIFPPLLGYLPFLTHTTILTLWLGAELRGGMNIVHDARLLPFMGYWGMAFSYQVSQLILAHVTKSAFPYWNGMMVYSLFGCIDANSKWLFGRGPLVQASPQATNIFVCMSFILALFNYIRFAREVIWQICEYTGIACFTVRRKNAQGQWVEKEEAKSE